MFSRNIGATLMGRLAVLIAPSVVAAPEIKVTDAWARAIPPVVRRSAAYFEIHNSGNEPDRLVGAAADVAEQSSLHETVERNGAYSMRHIMGVDIDPGKTLSFAPRGRHVMLIGLKQPLVIGAKFTLTLQFQKSGKIAVPVEVKPLTAR